ncbi:MAG: alpha/beta hydrolase [Anaerolineae bacterium]|nr:alpha/beta hydrolase [Anaerolineae bacterium]
MTAVYAVERATRQFATLPDGCIAYRTSGHPHNPPVLLAHGWLSHAGFWRSTMQALEQDFYVVALDHLGFGFSDKPADGDYSIPAQARRLLALVAHLGLAAPALIGHSMGGQIVLEAACQSPQQVRRVMTVGGVVTGAITPYFRRIFSLPLWLGYHVPATWAVSRFGMRRVPLYKQAFIDHAMTFQRDVIPMGAPDTDMALIPGIERPAYLAFHAFRAYDLTPRLAQLRLPVLITHGEQDNTVPVASAYHAHRHLPGSQLHIFAPCGHTPPLEVPAQFMQTVRDFVQQP